MVNINSLSDVQEVVDETYTYGITTYVYDSYVRVTNGSAGYYIDISIGDDGRLSLSGEQYGERIDTDCDATDAKLRQELRTII